MYARQAGWYASVPVEAKAKAIDSKQPKPVSRGRLRRLDGLSLDYPDTYGGEHVVRYFFEIGPATSTGMGEVQLTYSEMAAWQSLIGIVLQPWEAQCLREMSLWYLSEKNQGADPEYPAPYASPVVQDPAIIARRIKSLLRG